MIYGNSPSYVVCQWSFTSIYQPVVRPVAVVYLPCIRLMYNNKYDTNMTEVYDEWCCWLMLDWQPMTVTGHELTFMDWAQLKRYTSCARRCPNVKLQPVCETSCESQCIDWMLTAAMLIRTLCIKHSRCHNNPFCCCILMNICRPRMG